MGAGAIALLFASCRLRLLIEGNTLSARYGLFGYDLWIRDRTLTHVKSAGLTGISFNHASTISIPLAHSPIETAAMCALVTNLAESSRNEAHQAQYVRWGQPPSTCDIGVRGLTLPEWAIGIHGGKVHFRHARSDTILDALSLIASLIVIAIIGIAATRLGEVRLVALTSIPLFLFALGRALKSTLSANVLFDSDHVDIRSKVLGCPFRSQRFALHDVVTVASNGSRLVLYMGDHVQELDTQYPEDEMRAFAAHLNRLAKESIASPIDPPIEILDLVQRQRNVEPVHAQHTHVRDRESET